MWVDAHRFPAPAMWQGLMVIGLCVWALVLFGWCLDATPASDRRAKITSACLAAYTVAVSVFVWWFFR